jgi:two-component system, chemotaxis family, chemotaxis protein CheY
VTARLRILLVEDDRDVRESMRDLLTESGYDVVCAGEGRQALERLQDGPLPDLILLDLMMVGMDGYQFLVEMRRDPEQAVLPVLVLTAQGPGATSAETLGVAGVMRKPFEFDELIAEIRKFA